MRILYKDGKQIVCEEAICISSLFSDQQILEATVLRKKELYGRDISIRIMEFEVGEEADVKRLIETGYTDGKIDLTGYEWNIY